MFRKLLRFFYSKVFIGIHLDKDICQVNIIVVKNNKIKQNISTETKLIDGAISMETLKLIHFYQKKYPFTYIGMMSKTSQQGAVPSANAQEFLRYGINIKQNQILSLNNSWSIYLDKEECLRLSNQIPELGLLDYLFSPFLFIFMHAQKREKLSLYVLQEKKSTSLAICDSQRVFYGKTFDLQDDTPTLISQNSQYLSSSIDRLLSDLDQDIENFEISERKHDKKTEDSDDKEVDELNDFVRATFIANLLEQTIQAYYETNHSSFIDEIVFLDTYGMSLDALKYIKEALLIETSIIPFSSSVELTSLMLKEYRRNAHGA